MSYKERIHKYEAEKSRMLKSPQFLLMTQKEKDEAFRNLAKKWKV